MTAKELREKFLDFFVQKGHKIIPSASLIPEHDPTVLFTTAGMHPLVPYLLGEKHPQGQRLTSVQKCIRTGDIDDVGDAVHHTFFEMLGNWSLGDYFKKEAIEWSFEFLTKELKLSLDRLAFSVFIGNNDVSRDEESMSIWKALGISEKRIAVLPESDNWWGPAGQTGPCGPDTEMFYWSDDNDPAPEIFDPNDKRWVEIWNDVFMEYNKTVEANFEPLKQKNVDTGMGLERTVAVLNGLNDNYKTELFWPIIEKIEELSGKKYNSPHLSFNIRGGEDQENPPQPSFKKEGVELSDDTRAMRIIADHIKAATFILAEGLEPSNVERGYVLRRLIRRAVRYGKQLGIKDIFTFKVAQVVIEMYRDVYPELLKSREFIEEQLVREEEKFAKTLEKGLKQFEMQISKIKNQNDNLKLKIIPAEVVFDLYQTYGFPFEMTAELARESGLEVKKEDFEEELKKHQELSRAGAEQKFKGGLADNSEATIKYHTAAHLMLAALRQVLGEHVSQKGSNITVERLRFDFSHQEKMTPEQIKEVENLVNQKIQEDLLVKMEELGLEEAKEQGAMGVFNSKYGEKVKVYTISENGKIFSKEICGGPHVERTGRLGRFKIVKEESASAGTRRIKAILE